MLKMTDMQLFNRVKWAAIVVGTVTALLWCSYFISSCNTVRRIQSVSTTIIKDSVRNDSTRAVSRVDSNVHSHIEKDSAIGISGGESDIYLNAVDLKPVTDADGNIQERLFEGVSNNGSVHSSLFIGKDGKAHFRCKADSLTIVIKGLIRDSVFMSHRFDSLSSTMHTGDASIASLRTVVVEEHKGWWAKGLKTVIICILIGFVLGFFVKRFIA